MAVQIFDTRNGVDIPRGTALIMSIIALSNLELIRNQVISVSAASLDLDLIVFEVKQSALEESSLACQSVSLYTLDSFRPSRILHLQKVGEPLEARPPT